MTSMRSRTASASVARPRTSTWADRSATNPSTRPPPTARISGTVASTRARSRPVIATCAPDAASPRAVALPIPPVPPVISTVRPLIGRLPKRCAITVLSAGAEVSADLQAERRVLIGEQPDVRLHSQVVAVDVNEEVAKWPRILAGEQDGEEPD